MTAREIYVGQKVWYFDERLRRHEATVEVVARNGGLARIRLVGGSVTHCHAADLRPVAPEGERP